MLARSMRAPGVALLVLVLALVACGDDGGLTPTTAAPESGEPPDEQDRSVERRIERTVFDLVNDERRRRGLHELAWDDQLADAARRWSREMADRGALEHQGTQRMIERVDGFSGVGENIFTATGPVPASTIHVGWMRSDGHRANVLREGFDRLGVGVLCEDGGRVWATQRFGRTTGAELPRLTDEVPPQEPIVATEGEGPACAGAPGPVEIELPGP